MRSVDYYTQCVLGFNTTFTTFKKVVPKQPLKKVVPKYTNLYNLFSFHMPINYIHKSTSLLLMNHLL